MDVRHSRLAVNFEQDKRSKSAQDGSESLRTAAI
jgi:hypothetical protein